MDEEKEKRQTIQNTVTDLGKVLKEKRKIYEKLQAKYDAAKAELDAQNVEVEQKEELLQTLPKISDSILNSLSLFFFFVHACVLQIKDCGQSDQFMRVVFDLIFKPLEFAAFSEFFVASCAHPFHVLI
jgi:hypothetical protein